MFLVSLETIQERPFEEFNMQTAEAKYFWKQDRWNAGLSEDSRIGGVSRFSIGCDISSDSGMLKVARKPVRHDGNQINQEIDWIEQNPDSGIVYYYGKNKIFQEENGVTTLARELTADSPNGQGLRDFDGKLYYRTATQLGYYDYSTGEWKDDFQVGLNPTLLWGPMAGVKNVLCVGHGRNIGTVDDVGFWTPNRLTLPPGYNARSIFRAGSFAIILATRGTRITDSEEGLAFLWDTTSDTYNDYLPLDGNPHAGIANKNEIVIVTGQLPIVQKTSGGISDFVKSIPRVEDGDTAEVYPGAIDFWRNMVHFGISTGTSEEVIRAIYTWGAKKALFDPALNAEFPTPVYDASNDPGDLMGSGIQITACKKIGTTFRFAYKAGDQYGIAQIDTTQYQKEAIWRSLAFDRQSPFVKVADREMVELVNKLKTGESVTAKISPEPYEDPDFEDTDTLVAKTETTVGAKLLELPLSVSANPIRSRDLHTEFRLTGTGTTRPAIKRAWIDTIEEQDQL